VAALAGAHFHWRHPERSRFSGEERDLPISTAVMFMRHRQMTLECSTKMNARAKTILRIHHDEQP